MFKSVDVARQELLLFPIWGIQLNLSQLGFVTVSSLDKSHMLSSWLTRAKWLAITSLPWKESKWYTDWHQWIQQTGHTLRAGVSIRWELGSRLWIIYLFSLGSKFIFYGCLTIEKKPNPPCPRLILGLPLHRNIYARILIRLHKNVFLYRNNCTLFMNLKYFRDCK